MYVFQASSPAVEILGDAIIPVLKGISSQLVTQRLLRKYGLAQVSKGTFYSQQAYLDLLREVHQSMSMVLLGIGENIFSEAVFPPEIDSFEKALMSIDQAYHMNHRGGEIGHYLTKKFDSAHFQMTCDNPFPCNFDQGIVHGIAKSFGVMAMLTHAPDACRMRGNDHCVYQIQIVKCKEETRSEE